MRIFLPLLCVLCAAPVHSIFDGTCLRKEPPPGVLVLPPGSKLVLTCSGHVTVNGVKVSMARNSSNTNRRGSSSHAKPTTANIISNTGVSMKSDKHTMENAVSEGYHSNPTEAGENRSLEHTDTGHTASPTTHMVRPTSVSRPLEAEVTDGDYEEEEEEVEEGSRITRGIKLRPQWKWDGRTVGKGDRDWGKIAFEGATLSLSSVRLTDSGRYMCYHRGRERFSLKVIVADPPEDPTLSCYKKSPSSKIRCEWAPQQPVTIVPTCFLYFSKSQMEAFARRRCSYSPRRSRCWCALDHNDNELRIVHMAYLCVTSIAGNATSNLLHFTPLTILKPDPPSNVAVLPVVGLETRLKVTWGLPESWKSQDNFYGLTYQIKYKPLMSSFYHDQVQTTENKGSHTITDAMPGVVYLVQLRTKDEYDGQWSDWSTPVCNSSWTAPTTDMLPTDDTTMEGSGTDATDVFTSDPGPRDGGVDVSHPALWISVSFALLSVILAAYIFRHKDRFMSKLQSLSVVTHCGDLPPPPPSAPTAPEVQALVTFSPPRYKESPLSGMEEGEEGEEDNEEEQVEERTEAMHFNNTSYFFLQQ